MDDLQHVIDKYGNQAFGDLGASEQAEYLSALAKRGGEDGATSVLNKLGLNDDNAAADLKDIRDLLRGFRVVRNRAWVTITETIGKIVGWVIILSIAAFVVRYVGPLDKRMLPFLGSGS